MYHAKDESSGQQVALKAIKTRSLTPKIIANLELEIKILKQLRHPHIVSLLDVMVRYCFDPHSPLLPIIQKRICRNRNITYTWLWSTVLVVIFRTYLTEPMAPCP